MGKTKSEKRKLEEAATATATPRSGGEAVATTTAGGGDNVTISQSTSSIPPRECLDSKCTWRCGDIKIPPANGVYPAEEFLTNLAKAYGAFLYRADKGYVLTLSDCALIILVRRYTKYFTLEIKTAKRIA